MSGTNLQKNTENCIFSLENHPQAIQRDYENSCMALKIRKCQGCKFYKNKNHYVMDKNNFVEKRG